jgi:HSP20 family protein
MITRWDEYDRTFNVMSGLRRRLDRIFGEMEGDGRARNTAGWPRAALYDQGASLMVLAEVPGLSEKDIKLTLTGDALSVQGERLARTPEGYAVHRQERGAVRFARTFAFPCKVDVEHVTATVKNGMLTVTLPKSPESRPRQIAVRAG